MSAAPTLMIRPFEPSAASYAAIADVFNAAWPDHMRSPAAFRFQDDNLGPRHYFQRHVMWVDGRVAGYGELNSHPSKLSAGQYDITLNMRPALDEYGPDGATTRLYRHLREVLAPRRPVLILSWARSDRPARVGFLGAEGFEVLQQEIVTRLELATFDPAPFMPQRAALAAQGIQLASVQALQATDSDWERKLYAVDWAFRQDMPAPFPRVQEPLDIWRLRLQWPGYRADGHFVAVDERAGGAYVGVSGLGIRPTTPTRGLTTHTGVRRAYRRRGIARALKVAALTWARDQGLADIVTGNVEANPMLLLNRQLGFEVLHSRLLFASRPGGELT